MISWIEVPASAKRGLVRVLVDLDDYERLQGRRLSLGSHGYAQLFDGKVQTLHRWLFGLTGQGYTIIVDHVNRNKLDNRRSNLRLVSPALSNLNRQPQDSHWVGVNIARSGRFTATVKRNRQSVHLGTYDTKEEARQVRMRYLKSLRE